MTPTHTKINKTQTTLSRRRISGQGMTEYIIIVALIALAAITVVGFFGETVQQQFAGMSQKLAGGDPTNAQTAAGKAAKGAESNAGAAGLNNY